MLLGRCCITQNFAVQCCCTNIGFRLALSSEFIFYSVIINFRTHSYVQTLSRIYWHNALQSFQERCFFEVFSRILKPRSSALGL